jgi:hypothetical protein
MAAIAQLNASGVEQLAISFVNVSSVDTSDLQNDLVHAINMLFANISDPDLFVASFSPDLFPCMNSFLVSFHTYVFLLAVVNAFEVVQPQIKAAVYVGNMWKDVQQTYQLGDVGDYWITVTV